MADFSFEDTQQEEGPQDVFVEGLGEARAVLVEYELFEHYQKRNARRAQNSRQGTEGDIGIEAKDMAEIFNEYYIDPEFDLTTEDVKKMKPSYPGALLEALTGEGVSVEMNADGSATVSTDKGNSDE